MYNHSMNTLWDDAVNDKNCICLNTKRHQAYIYKGIKIIKTLSDIKIYNTRKQGFEYKEITDEEYYYFLQYGFRTGVRKVLKGTYIDQIDKINNKIQEEVNSRNNKKHYDSLKHRRETLINKYSKLN